MDPNAYMPLLPYLGVLLVPLFLAFMILHGIGNTFKSGMTKRDRVNGVIIMLLSLINFGCLFVIARAFHLLQF